MNEQDMRVIKTRESIENALFELLGRKPLGKITVAELARTARINKSTFYLHYLDINDLYGKTLLKTLIVPIERAEFFPDFFDAPERFADRLQQLFTEGIPKMKRLLQGQHRSMIYDALFDVLMRRVYDTGRISRSRENDMRLAAVFSALLSISPKYYAECAEETDAVTASMIRLFFPQARAD